MPNVVLAGADRMFSEALGGLLKEDGINVVAMADDKDSVARYTNGHKPDVLLTHSGLRFAWDKMIAVINDDVHEALRALNDGAHSLVTKCEGREELTQAIRSDKPYINPRLSIDIIREQEKADRLTERERQILILVAQGYTNAEAALELFLSVRTIESHRAHIMEKLDAHSRRDLVTAAIDMGLFRGDKVFA